MSKERELLKRLVSVDLSDIYDLLIEAQELLAQPETKQKPVAWQVIGIAGFMYVYNKPSDQVYDHHTVNALYTAPPKREPLSDKEIHAYLSLMEPPFLWDEGFCSGIEWAEKQHGIGGGE